MAPNDPSYRISIIPMLYCDFHATFLRQLTLAILTEPRVPDLMYHLPCFD